ASRQLYFIRTRRPPLPTLFPYTTLFRSGAECAVLCTIRHLIGPDRFGGSRRKSCLLTFGECPKGWPSLWLNKSACLSDAALHQRSEEHTSELQSRGHLVCRLLLEKKKNQ